MRTVDVDHAPLAELAAALDEVSARRLESGAHRARTLLAGRTVWNVSGFETGGVAELIRMMLPYAADAGVDVRWLVLDGDPEFDALVTRLAHALHGRAGDGGALGPVELEHYERVLDANLAEVREAVRPGDVVVLHDPATAGLAPSLARRGAHVVWRCHVGADLPDDVSDRAWAFLEPFVAAAERVVVSRASFRPGFLDPETVAVIAPSIDPLSPKNRALDDATVRDLLRGSGILAGGDGETSVLCAGGPIPESARVVVQLSKWDRLKDMTGVLIAFDEGAESLPDDVHLLLAGAEAGDRDPEGAEVLERCRQMWEGLEKGVRARVHIACLPVSDTTGNALIVNAVQRYASVVVQKSLAEGFGLTVAEALWKARPVVASAVGGIRDQIDDGVNGLLLADPRDLQGLIELVGRLLAEPAFAAQLGATAHDRVRREYLSDRHLLQYLDLLDQVL